MFDISDGLIAAIFTGIGVLVTAAGTILKVKWDSNQQEKRGDNADKRSETEQALSMYKDLIASLKTDIDKMMTYLHELEKEHSSCRQENMKLNMEMKMLKDRVAQLEGNINGNIGI